MFSSPSRAWRWKGSQNPVARGLPATIDQPLESGPPSQSPMTNCWFYLFRRTYFNLASVRYWTPSLIKLVEEEAQINILHGGPPSSPGMLINPHNTGRRPSPLNSVFFSPPISSRPCTTTSRIMSSRRFTLQIGARYDDYAVFDTSLASVYGENLSVLRKLKKRTILRGL